MSLKEIEGNTTGYVKHIYEGELKHAALEGLYLSGVDFYAVLDEACGTETRFQDDVDYGPVRITIEQLEEAGECEADEDIAAGRVESFKSLDELTDWLEADDE